MTADTTGSDAIHTTLIWHGPPFVEDCGTCYEDSLSDKPPFFPVFVNVAVQFKHNIVFGGFVEVLQP